MSAVTDTETKRKGPPKRGNGGKGNGQANKPTPKPDEVPVLKYGAACNFATFKPKLATKAMTLYGDLARCINTHEYYEPLPVEIEHYDANEDPLGLILDGLKYESRSRAKHIAKMKQDRTPFYGFILTHLSRESLDAVKMHEHFSQVEAELDPLSLWLIVESTHTVASASRNRQL